MAASKMAMMASLTQCRPLTCTASAAASYPSRLVPNPPDLIKWVRREGGFVHEAVEISHDGPNGLGLIASRGIPKGSELISLPDHIPLKFALDGGNGADSVLVNLARQIPEELWAMKLGLRLLQERAKVESFWWPYISNLPETYSVPIFFSGEDIKNLQYAPLLHQVNKRCRFLLNFEKSVKHVLENLKPKDHPFGCQDVDASSLGWAMTAVSSRAFRLHGEKLPNGTRIDVPMMLPLIDMCNHSFCPNAHIVQDQDAGNTNMSIKVLAKNSIKQNEPFQLNYGCLSNDLFLLDYGFVLPLNPYDCIELKYDGALLDAASVTTGIPTHISSPAPWQQQILLELNFEGEAPNLKVKLGGPELVEGRFLAALRVLFASDAETVQKHDLNTLKSLSAEAPLGIANEVAVLRTIVALCLIALDHFPTKVTEDESLLKQGVSASTKLAIQFRVLKKYVILDVMRDLGRRVRLLLSKDKAPTQS